MRRIAWILIGVPFVLFVGFFSARAPAEEQPQQTTEQEKMKEVEKMFASPYTEEMYYRTDRLLLTATGSLQPLHRAPAVASVITAEDIEAMGATTLDEVLETVPGVHVSPSSSNALNSIFSFRGISTSRNPEVLLLMNGIPFPMLLTGGRPDLFRLPVADISRIEVIRGPGSAIYGADAFAGVINVITKSAKELGTFSSGVRAGSFNTYDAWVQHGGTHEGWDVAFSLEEQETRGDKDRIISADEQSALDKIFHTHASLAPGPLNTQYRLVDGHLTLERDNWTMRLWTWFNLDAGLGAGVTDALAPLNKVTEEQYLADVTYHNKDLLRDWDLSSTLSFLYLKEDYFTQLFPPGAVLPVGSDGNINFIKPVGLVRFTDGVIGEPDRYDHHGTIEFTGLYTGFDEHRLRLSTGFQYLAEEHGEFANFGPGVINGKQPVVNGILTDLTGTPFIYNPDKARELEFISAQDAWSFARGWELTTGVRYDHYSDFGGTVNPRVALVWETRPDLTTKLLFGTAFSPPSFADLYNKNNPATLGNPNLKPETIKTPELVFDYQPTSNLRTILNIFYYDVKGLIELVPNPGQTTETYQNAVNQQGYGFELEQEWKIAETFRLRGSFSLQVSEQTSEETKAQQATPDTPGVMVKINPHWDFLPNWSLDAQYFWIGDRSRDRISGDTRPDISDYSLVNLTLRRKNIAQHWDVALAARNLLGANIREPATVSIPNDIPMPGRSIYGEIRYKF